LATGAPFRGGKVETNYQSRKKRSQRQKGEAGRAGAARVGKSVHQKEEEKEKTLQFRIIEKKKKKKKNGNEPATGHESHLGFEKLLVDQKRIVNGQDVQEQKTTGIIITRTTVRGLMIQKPRGGGEKNKVCPRQDDIKGT